MRMVIFGAGGGVGTRTVTEALARGHEVTAVVRGPGRPVPEGAHVVYGDASDTGQVATLASGHDAAVSAVRAPDGMEASLAATTGALLDGCAAGGVRLLVVGGAATLRVADSGLRVLEDSRYIGRAWLAAAEASAAQHRRCVEETAADWTYLSPPAMLVPGERTGTYRSGGDELLVDADGVSRIASEDLAVAVVDELETPRHRRRRFTVAERPVPRER